MLEIQDEEAWKGFVHLRPEPTLDEPITGVLSYPLPQIHDHTGQPLQENKVTTCTGWVKAFFILFYLIW